MRYLVTRTDEYELENIGNAETTDIGEWRTEHFAINEAEEEATMWAGDPAIFDVIDLKRKVIIYSITSTEAKNLI